MSSVIAINHWRFLFFKFYKNAMNNLIFQININAAVVLRQHIMQV